MSSVYYRQPKLYIKAKVVLDQTFFISYSTFSNMYIYINVYLIIVYNVNIIISISYYFN